MSVAERDGIWSRGGAPVEELPDPFAIRSEPFEHWAEPAEDAPPPPKKRGKWRIAFYALSGLLLLTLAWLIVTAPLSRALEPLDIISPGQRRRLLKENREDYRYIARTFLGRANGVLFREPAPVLDPAWKPRPPLSDVEIATCLLNLIDE